MGRKIVIIGGVAGGASAAARLRRWNEEDEIMMFERGEHVSFATVVFLIILAARSMSGRSCSSRHLKGFENVLI
ncbi:hypothetical protein HPL003_10185 [Paenibacillus terrae HPL-003]|uniref:Uncharacterized protein n=1 Tax=Paenibacillus terrae (strain HPL-003) TaxID=985665 RepID=G7VV29_PAETH|nr:hypothetical protein HPL003_10185 [Paenibacillus terrae HPL-003]